MNKSMFYKSICLFLMSISFVGADIAVSNTGAGNLSSLGGLDSKWFYSVSSATDLSQQATIMYPNAVYQPGYPTNPLDPGFNSPLSRFLGTANNNGTYLDGSRQPVTNGTVSDPAGTSYFTTVIEGLGVGDVLFRYETDNILTNIYKNGVSLFASPLDFSNFIAAEFNPANTSNQQFFGFNGDYLLTGLSAGDILSFEIFNEPQPGEFGNPLSFRAELVATPEPMTYVLMGSFIACALYVRARRRVRL